MKPNMFKIAKKLSYKSPSKYKLGCVISDKNRVISVGFNDMNKTHPKAKSHWNTLHAEVHSIVGLDYNETKGAVAYIYRQFKNGKPANAKPCISCQMALKLAGIKKVYYTDSIAPYWKELDLRKI